MQNNNSKHTSKLYRGYIMDKENCRDLKYMYWRLNPLVLNQLNCYGMNLTGKYKRSVHPRKTVCGMLLENHEIQHL